MSRWKAAFIHLSISVAIALIVGGLLLGVWYPPPYFHAAGADELVLLLSGVDVVLGPLLTLVVFKSGKRGLKLDLALIALVQSVALIYGLSVVLRSRPVFLVAAVDRFTLVSAVDIREQDLAKGDRPEFRSLSWTGPRLVAAKLPSSNDQRSELVSAAMGGRDLENLPQYYVDYQSAAADLLKRAKALDALPNIDESNRERLEQALHAMGRAETTLRWLPIASGKADMIMLIDSTSGEPLKAVPVNPWPT